MINCLLSVDTDERTECMALDWKWYISMIKNGYCGTDRCPFWKARREIE